MSAKIKPYECVIWARRTGNLFLPPPYVFPDAIGQYPLPTAHAQLLFSLRVLSQLVPFDLDACVIARPLRRRPSQENYALGLL